MRVRCSHEELLRDPVQLHEALQEAHKTMGLEKVDKVLQRPARPTDEVGDQPAAANPGLNEQDAASAARRQEVLANAAALAKRAT